MFDRNARLDQGRGKIRAQKQGAETGRGKQRPTEKAGRSDPEKLR
jgi:hypothetical protein